MRPAGGGAVEIKRQEDRIIEPAELVVDAYAGEVARTAGEGLEEAFTVLEVVVIPKLEPAEVGERIERSG